jgi:hypothetical protein
MHITNEIYRREVEVIVYSLCMSGYKENAKIGDKYLLGIYLLFDFST